MIRTAKNYYEAPSTESFEIAIEGVVCASTTQMVGTPTYSGMSTTEQEW